MRRLVLVLLALGLLAAGVAAYLAYRGYAEAYQVETEERAAIARVVTSAFEGRSDLRVGTLTGTVQSVATDSRAFGMLNSDQVVKAPYSVDYFVDMSQIGLDDYIWDPKKRTLTVRLPAVEVGRANVDESRRTLVRTRGVFVTRGAGEKLAQANSARAQRLASAKAREPEQVARARERAKTVVASFLGAPLAAAGLNGVRIVTVFPDETARGDTDQWDVTRSLREVLADPKYE